MLVDIKPVRNEAFNCFYSVIATLCGHYGIEYDLIFIGLWGFDFDVKNYEKNTPIGARISTGVKDFGNAELLEKYVGIKLCWHNIPYSTEVLGLIQQEILQGRPVTIFSDLFWCPWNLAYQKYKFPHYYLIAGVNEESSELLCVDPYISNNRELLSLEAFKKGYKSCMTFRPTEKKALLPISLDLVGNTIDYISASDGNPGIFHKIRDLAHVIEVYLDFSVELNGYDDIYAVPLFDNIKAVASNRRAFAKTLDYLGIKLNINELCSLAEEMRRVAEKWGNIRLNLMKLSMMPGCRERLEKCALKVKEIADTEEELAYRITWIVKRNA